MFIIMKSIQLLKTLRTTLLNSVSDLTPEQLLITPPKFNNNILWNLAHLAVTQQILNYKLSGQAVLVSEKLLGENKKGTSPKNWTETPNLTEIKDLLISLPEKLETDYNNGLFKQFDTYKTSMGIELNDINDSIEFNNFHEGLHMGAITMLKKLVA